MTLIKMTLYLHSRKQTFSTQRLNAKPVELWLNLIEKEADTFGMVFIQLTGNLFPLFNFQLQRSDQVIHKSPTHTHTLKFPKCPYR